MNNPYDMTDRECKFLVLWIDEKNRNRDGLATGGTIAGRFLTLESALLQARGKMKAENNKETVIIGVDAYQKANGWDPLDIIWSDHPQIWLLMREPETNGR